MSNLSAESHILHATKLLLILDAVKKTPRIKNSSYFRNKVLFKSANEPLNR
jgi:hypothetical protein